MLVDHLLPIDYRRRQLLKHCHRQGALHTFLETPFPSSKSDYRDVPCTCVDFETTGLDNQKDHILSMGMVDVGPAGVELATATHVIVRSPRQLPAKTVTIHRLTDDMVEQGIPIAQALEKLLERLAGKVLIAHHARIECGFIRQAVHNLYDCSWLAPVIDTQQLALRRLSRYKGHLDPAELRLDSLRQHYHLPAYQAHNALADAIATAELFLAETAEIRGNDPQLALGKLLGRC